MKIAIVHDYLYQAGGAERVVEVFHKMFPEAPIYTSVCNPDSLWPALRDADIRTSWMQRLPGLEINHKAYVLLYPRAIESFDLSGYDLVISSSSAFGKGAITPPETCHVCYCHNPMRFVWDYERYVERERYGRLTRLVLPPIIKRLRRWDLRTADRPDFYVANSTVVKQRIQERYGREAEVIFPPVGVGRYEPVDEIGDFHLCVSRLVTYKRIDLAVEAFNRLGSPLVVIGDDPDLETLKEMAGLNIRFLGRLPDKEVADHYARCRAFILPGEEDFGITPLEANAAGRPVIAYRAGGALDTVVDGKTGVYFNEQTPESLADAVRRAETIAWDVEAIRRHAESFSEENFRSRFLDFLERALEEFGKSPAALQAM